MSLETLVMVSWSHQVVMVAIWHHSGKLWQFCAKLENDKYRKFSKNCHIEMPTIICRRMKMPSPHGHPELFLVLYLKMVSFFIDYVWGKRYRPAKTRFQAVLHYFYTSKNCIKCLREMPAIFSRKVIKIKWKNNVEYGW